MPPPTKDQIATAVNALRDAAKALAELIREETTNSPLGGIPAGHLYARFMPHTNLETLEMMIGLLVNAKLVRRMPSHLLVWTGGVKPGLSPEEEIEFQSIRNSHQGDATWRRYQELESRRES